MSAEAPDLAAATEQLRRLHAKVAEMEQQAAEAGRSERRLVARDAVASALSESGSLADAAPQILRAICETLSWHMGALWVVERDQVRCVEVWHRQAAGIPKFAGNTHARTFSRGEGLPGRVWATAQAVWIHDVTGDPNFPRAGVAAREALRSALGFPIAVAGTVQGVMEFFSADIREPDHELLAMLAALGGQIGQFIERKHAEQILDRFFTLSLDMLCIAGFDGRFRRLNPAWQHTLGYSIEELTASPFVDFVHPEDRQATLAEMEKLTTGSDTLSFENRYRAREGSYRWMLWTATPDAQDQLVYAAARDITERKAAEEKIQRLKEAAEAASRAKSNFLAHMSHEMRTPLTAIIGMGDLLGRTRLTDEQRQYIATLQRAGSQLLRLINDLLDLAKAESGNLALESVEFRLEDVLAKALEIGAVAARAKGLALRHELSPDVPERLTGDPDRLRQVLINLVGNAVKFTATGEVVVRVERDAEKSDPYVLRFSVSDTGIGIPEDKLGAIFHAFVQADRTTWREYGGTGLGLAIVKRFVELMGGRSWAESNAGTGSTFYFTARFSERHAPEPGTGTTPETVPAGRPLAPPIRALRILIAEDSEDIRFLLASYLKDTGHQADFAENGNAAVEKFYSGSYDLVFMDVQMPVVDGYTATRRIRSWERERNLEPAPILALTAFAAETEKAQAAAGCTSCLAKPILFQPFMDAIAVWGGGRRDAMSPEIEAKLRSLTPGYLAGRRRDVEAIERALEQEDYKTIWELGHRMSGTGGAFGIPQITRIGGRLQKAAGERDAETLRSSIAELAELLGRLGEPASFG